jgi:putative phosphoesterase
LKIGVISDTHGIVPAWDKAMELFADADLIVHAGDVLYHPPRLGCTPGYDIVGLVDRMNACTIPIVIARGNCDSEVYEELLKMPVLAPYAFVEWGGLRIVIEHGHNISPEQMKQLTERYRADVFITGHTHLPVVERLNGSIHLNPGSPAHPKLESEGRLIPTVGIITDGQVSVVELETGRTVGERMNWG